jgi:hypothetical protein
MFRPVPVSERKLPLPIFVPTGMDVPEEPEEPDPSGEGVAAPGTTGIRSCAEKSGLPFASVGVGVGVACAAGVAVAAEAGREVETGAAVETGVGVDAE